jgi:hypothetical protein
MMTKTNLKMVPKKPTVTTTNRRNLRWSGIFIFALSDTAKEEMYESIIITSCPFTVGQ